MKYSLIIDAKKEEEIIIYAHAKNELIEKIEELVNDKEINIYGYMGDEIIKFDIQEVSCFFIENGKVYGYIGDEKYYIKYRLYELEAILGNSFIKINQSCIANISHIKKFDVSISGSLKVIFKNDYYDYVSRRELKKVKERVGI